MSMQESYVETRNLSLKGACGQQLPFFPQHLKWKKCNSQAIILDGQLKYFEGQGMAKEKGVHEGIS